MTENTPFLSEPKVGKIVLSTSRICTVTSAIFGYTRKERNYENKIFALNYTFFVFQISECIYELFKLRKVIEKTRAV